MLVSGPVDARGLAVLLGWAGGSLRNVQKHAAAWHALGWRTAVVTVSVEMTFLPMALTAVAAAADELDELATAHRARAGPSALLVAHTFSNSGVALMMAALLRSRPLHFDGAVHDSGPSSLESLRPAAAPLIALSAGLPRLTTAATLSWALPYALIAEAAAPIVGTAGAIGLHERLRDAEVNPPRAELYIYSAADALVPSADVEAYVRCRQMQQQQQQRRRRRPLASCRFDDSGHCSHYRMHPVEYGRAIEAFVRGLESSDEQLEGHRRDNLQRNRSKL